MLSALVEVVAYLCWYALGGGYLTEYGLFSVGPSLTLNGHVLFGPPVWCPREEARRILVSSSGTHSVRSDRVAPDSLRIFRGL